MKEEHAKLAATKEGRIQGLRQLKPNEMYRLLRFLRNPEGAVGYNMLRLLSKGGPILGAIAAIASSPEVIKDIIQAMGKKGFPANADWHRRFDEELLGSFRQEDQKEKILGSQYFTVTQIDRFTAADGSPVYNSLLERDEDRLTKIGQEAKTRGLA